MDFGVKSPKEKIFDFHDAKNRLQRSGENVFPSEISCSVQDDFNKTIDIIVMR